ncbi:hypothetical protein [Chryseobacterium oncorhynchi]|nr:hypothetical protein [Chryseobacterium oncorhynchi]
MESVTIINHYYITHYLSLAPIEAVTPQQELEKRDKIWKRYGARSMSG